MRLIDADVLEEKSIATFHTKQLNTDKWYSWLMWTMPPPLTLCLWSGVEGVNTAKNTNEWTVRWGFIATTPVQHSVMEGWSNESLHQSENKTIFAVTENERTVRGDAQTE